MFLQAGAYYTNNQFIEADSLYNLVIASSVDKINMSMPVEANPFYYKAAICFQLGKDDSTLYYFSKVVPFATDSTDILMMRAQAYNNLGKADSSIIVCNKILSLQKDSAVALFIRGDNYFKMGKYDQACKDLNYAKSNGISTSDLDEQLRKCK